MSTFNDYWIKDINLASRGELHCKEALRDMEGLISLEKRFTKTRPFKGIRIVGSVHVSYETANFILLLKDLGANVRWCSDSFHYSNDEACAYIASKGIPIFAKQGLTLKEYYWAFDKAVKFKSDNNKQLFPQIIITDGAELAEYLLKNYPTKLNNLKAMLEQTTSGINFMYSQYINKERLPFPIININESVTKAKFDNVYGSRESLLEGVLNAINIQLAGRKVILFGYGEVGKGCAQAMRGVGARVAIVEIDPITAMQALMEGYDVVSKDEACRTGEIFITTTSCIKTIDELEILKMGNGSILMNMSEHDMEINSHFFRHNSKLKKIKINKYCDKYIFPDGKEIYLLCDGFIVNLYAGKGHPPKVMGITFTNHIIALIDLLDNPDKYTENKVYRLSRHLDEEVALLCFPQLKEKMNTLTQDQAEYLGVNINGPYKRDSYRY